MNEQAAHLLELGHSLPADKGRLEEIGTADDERRVLGDQSLDHDPRGLSRGDGLLGQVFLLWQVLLPALPELSGDSSLELGALLWVGSLVLGEQLVPIRLVLGTPGLAVFKVVVDLVGDDKLFVGVKAELLLDMDDIVITESGTVDGSGLGFGRADTDDGSDVDEDWFALDLLGFLEGVDNGSELKLAPFAFCKTYVVGTVVHLDNLPVASLELGRGVVGEARVDVAVDSDGVIVVDEDQVVETKVAGHGDG
jgi:hypothetical protein